ncbi:MAG: AmmeMemoRadiSam system protein A [Armatimonadota bacterium]
MLTDEQRATLLSLARQSLEAAARGAPLPQPTIDDEALTRPSGGFVTLKVQERLRGCIGLIEPLKPLYQTVIDMARSAALEDPRFPPVEPEEVPQIRIEISVLSPPEPVEDAAAEIEVGRHGLIVRKGPYSGLLLPQVPVEWNWDRDEFLAQTCTKAGLPRDAWREPGTEVQRFSAEVFREQEA